MPSDAPVRIRPASAEDMPTVARVLGPRHADFYGRHLDRGGLVLAAWRSDQLVGAVYVSWGPADERKIRLLLPGVPLLHHLHILEGRRREKIGTQLVRAAEALARERGHRRVAVGIDLENRAAVLLYRHLGFHRWRWGKVRTVRDLYHPDGRLAGRQRDKCRIFVKDLRK